MQTQANTPAADAIASATAHAEAATVAAQAKQAKAAERRAAQSAKPATPAKASRKAAKPEAVAKPAKRKADPEAAAKREAERTATLDATRDARRLASTAVRAFYANASLPFKAAADRFSDLRTDKPAKRPSQRQAALLAAMLLAGDNIKRDGTFTRGAFVIDGRNVQPETGALSDMLGRVVTYVSGPLSGAAQRDAVFRVDLKAAASEITALLSPSAMRTAALQRLASLGVKQPSA